MEPHITENGKYRIEPLSAATVHGALQVIKESLCQDENVCIGTEVNKNDLAGDEFVELCVDTALDGVSLVAVHVATGDVVSAIFNKLQVATADPSERSYFEIFVAERCTHPSSRAVVEFMIDVDGKFNFFEKFGLDCCLELMCLATHREHRRNALGFTLLKMSIELARTLRNGPIATLTVKDLGPKYAFIPERQVVSNVPKFCQALLTTDITQRFGQTLGFTVYSKIPLRDYYFNGKSYTERIGRDAWCELVALIL